VREVVRSQRQALQTEIVKVSQVSEGSHEKVVSQPEVSCTKLLFLHILCRCTACLMAFVSRGIFTVVLLLLSSASTSQRCGRRRILVETECRGSVTPVLRLKSLVFFLEPFSLIPFFEHFPYIAVNSYTYLFLKKHLPISGGYSVLPEQPSPFQIIQ
jgi:hypothetical protein